MDAWNLSSCRVRLSGASGPGVNHERRLLLGAIQLIASGGAPRVTLVGLQSAERLLAQAHSLEMNNGVRIRGDWTDGACELTVEKDR